ncbi:MAG: RsfS/YbeB/iojap family protein, partial [Planctomycetes bacterium]|nr:RsfS/YbeB/iojap family protein [Planctomycetota bacterium]
MSTVETISPEELARLALGCLEDKKASDIRTLNVVEKTILADFFIIASVESTRQARAIADFLRRELREH